MKLPGRLPVAALPALILLLGWLGLPLLQPAGEAELNAPLSSFPTAFGRHELREDRTLGERMISIMIPDDYLLRTYANAEGVRWDLYIAFYGRQSSGSSIHSPRNCLPGSGWEPTAHERVPIETWLGAREVNRYVVEHESGARALVYYWYQGRGRIEANEYRVKWDLIRDAVVKRRTDETLVRVVLPLRQGEPVSDVEDRALLAQVAGALQVHLPG
jgi:EpsI family protein